MGADATTGDVPVVRAPPQRDREVPGYLRKHDTAAVEEEEVPGGGAVRAGVRAGRHGDPSPRYRQHLEDYIPGTYYRRLATHVSR